MSDARSFNCPNCGSSLHANGSEKAVQCPYCGSSVIVPEELRDPNQAAREELTPEQDLFSPRHVEWLVQNGVEVTVKVDWVKERDKIQNGNPVVDLFLAGKKTNGKKFENMATLNVPRNLIPKKGSAVKIKYNGHYEYDTEDFVIQIGGQYLYAFTSDDDELTELMNL